MSTLSRPGDRSESEPHAFDHEPFFRSPDCVVIDILVDHLIEDIGDERGQRGALLRC